MKDIDYTKYVPFMRCGWDVIDDIIGGIPSDGPIVVFGTTGVGKSHWAAKMVCSLLKQHPKKLAGIYTLEMSAEHYLNREAHMYPELEKFGPNRLYVSGSVRNIEELVAEVTSKRLDVVVIDDMDGLVEDESAGAYQRVYKRIREICRFLKIPVIVLAQPNRAAKMNLNDRFLSPYDISWSGAGENSAALLIALQKANSLEMNDTIYPLDNTDHLYMIFLKSRDGWPEQMGPGAIRLDGANRNKLWSGEAYKGKLFPPIPAKSQKLTKKERQ
jgi:replicative DNA helicase